MCKVGKFQIEMSQALEGKYKSNNRTQICFVGVKRQIIETELKQPQPKLVLKARQCAQKLGGVYTVTQLQRSQASKNRQSGRLRAFLEICFGECQGRKRGQEC
jgi:hypothetical protein